VSQAGVDELLAQARDAVAARRLAEARVLLEQGLAEAPGHLMALDLLGFVCFFLGDYAACEQHCRAALARKPDHAYATKGLGLALARQGRVDEGIRKLERALALEPHWLDPYWDLVVVLVEHGRWREADEVVRQAEATVPGADARFAELARQIRARLAG
jgi:tetratricopeptide (TPR) repeat protein